MNSTLESFQNTKRFFPPDFIASLSEESFLYRLLVEQSPKGDVWRKHIDDCLELAYRYNLVDSDLEARLKKDDWESWQATSNELGVAKFLESILGFNSLQWHPEGQKGKIGEFNIGLVNLDKPIFVEVKTIFPRELENLENRVFQKIRRCVERVQLPFSLSVQLRDPGKTENFSTTKLRHYLKEELGKPLPLLDYRDNATGFHLKITAYPTTGRDNCHLQSCTYNVRFMNSAPYIHHSLNKAYRKLRKDQPNFVVLCPYPNYLVEEEDKLNALLGTLVYTFTLQSDSSTRGGGSARLSDGFFQPRRNRKLSAVGFYTQTFGNSVVHANLEVYHNHFSRRPIDYSTFKSKGVRQLVKKNNKEREEWEWIE
ncbi:hypothetical protein ES703_45101 [subsurface metagenome]